MSVLRRLGYKASARVLNVTKYFPTINDSRNRAQIGAVFWAPDYPSASDTLAQQLSCKAFVPRSPVAESPYRVELRHFVERLADGAPFRVDGEEGVRSLALALAALDSVRTGRVVTFPIED